MGLFDFLKRDKKPAMGSAESNDGVRAVLASMDDDGTAVRHVLHYAYPTRRADKSLRDNIIGVMKARGFDVSDAAAGGGVVMEQYRSVSPDDFDAYTAELHEWFASQDWEYDGWECAVVQDAAADDDAGAPLAAAS